MSTTSHPRRSFAAPLVLGLVAMLGLAPTASAGFAVTITDFQFSPKTFSASQGFSVGWTNQSGGTTHSVTSDGTLAFWPSTDIPNTGSFLKQFKAAGTFPYHCRFHPSMTGKIKVPLLVDHVGVDFTATAKETDWPAASPFRNVIQVRPAGSSAWITLSQNRHGSATFHATQGAGEYGFRSAVRRASNGAMSLWSKVVKIVIG